MQKIDAASPEAQSADLVAGNIEQFKAMFPELITEGPNGVSVNVDVLKALVGDKIVTDADEKYGLNWHGKRRARQLALTPSTGTLRPCPEDSVGWDTTQNLMIEGDNLEVLKLLQKSYAGKVKLIYIDPPYNTGKDFVYPDNFQDNIKNYLELTGQVEGGRKISSNTEASGRFHTDWLNMMYPRLKLARNLLRKDGVIFVSLDDGEIENLRLIIGEVFGEENFVAQILWKKRSTPPNDKIIGANHDYIALFCNNSDAVTLNLKKRSQLQIERYKNPDNHPKGPWAPGDLMANIKGGRYVESLNYPIVNPKTGQQHMPSETERGNWRFSKEKMGELLSRGEIYFGDDEHGRPKLKRFLCDVKAGVTYSTIWDFVPFNTEGSSEMQGLFGNSSVFESPKPVELLQEILKLGSNDDDVILDFFAGSGTTGHAVMAQNATDAANRRYILVQLPEPLTPTDIGQKNAAEFCDTLQKQRTIAEITKERLRRAAAKIKADNPMFAGDTGFRVFKLDHSNIRAWNPNPTNLEQTLFAHQDHLVEGRTESDILYELLLKLGLDLCVPIEQRTVNGKDVHSVGGGILLACLAERITVAEAELLAQGIVAWHKALAPAGDTTCVFRDSAFADDVAKTNLAAILEQQGIRNVRSL
ncbi:MAG: site-specific DNA-methyltransferase [Ferrovum sp. 34-44-207]|nr:MAG: site-specific DNA-methyltransferase [Ferrovum sp. 34-44-207]